MRPPRVTLVRVWLGLTLAVMIATALGMAYPESAPEWADDLFLPAFVGGGLVGGVHGSEPGWLLSLAMIVSSALVYSCIPIALIAFVRWLMHNITRRAA